MLMNLNIVVLLLPDFLTNLKKKKKKKDKKKKEVSSCPPLKRDALPLAAVASEVLWMKQLLNDCGIDGGTKILY